MSVTLHCNPETYIESFFTNFNKMDIDGKISSMLRKCKAIIAGGCNLSLIHNLVINDIDVYVHKDNIETIIFEILEMGYIFSNKFSYFMSPYDKSFFRKNNILSRFQFKKEECPDIDLLVVNVEDVTSVVKNFDLTFCKSYFNGSKLYSFCTKEDLINKVGILCDDYYPLYEEKNGFIYTRLYKYIQRGYTISNINVKQIKKTIEKEMSTVKSTDIIKSAYVNSDNNIIECDSMNSDLITKTVVYNYVINLVSFVYANDEIKERTEYKQYDANDYLGDKDIIKMGDSLTIKLKSKLDDKWHKYIKHDNIKLFIFMYTHTPSNNFFINDFDYKIQDFFELFGINVFNKKGMIESSEKFMKIIKSHTFINHGLKFSLMLFQHLILKMIIFLVLMKENLHLFSQKLREYMVVWIEC